MMIRDEERLLMTTIVMKNKIWDQSVIFFTRSGILNYLYTTDAKDRNGNEIMLRAKDGLNLLSFL